MSMKEILIYMIPIVVSVAISIILFLKIKSKSFAVLLSIFVLISAICMILWINNWSDTVIKNEYVTVDIKGLKYEDLSDYTYPCYYKIYKNDISDKSGIVIGTNDIDSDFYNDMKEDINIVEAYLSGYCGGSFNRIFGGEDIENEEVESTGERGFYIENKYYEYQNSYYCEKEVHGINKIVVVKILHINNGQMIIAELSLENSNYDFYINGQNENILQFRDCFKSIKPIITEE